jgi:uncharacterized protein (TIGR01777 family)
MNVLVTGATGLIGQAVSLRLTAAGHRIIPLSRRRAGPEVRTAAGPTWDPESSWIDLEPAGSIDAVVHLAGETIAQRWTAAAKQRIRSSRVEGTQLLVEALVRQPYPPRVLICASATGYYGDRRDVQIDETSSFGSGFLAEVCRDWEAAVVGASECGIRVAHLRLGIVLAGHGGALARMVPVFRLGLGGRLGNGRQYWPWIALEDLAMLVGMVLEQEHWSGPINAVAPNPITNEQFTKALARALHRPALVPVPRFVLVVLFGTMAREALLGSARVMPRRLLEGGFAYRLGRIDAALNAMVG